MESKGRHGTTDAEQMLGLSVSGMISRLKAKRAAIDFATESLEAHHEQRASSFADVAHVAEQHHDPEYAKLARSHAEKHGEPYIV